MDKPVMYYVLEDEHDGYGWCRVFGDKQLHKSEAEEYVQEQHYARLADEREFGFPHDEQSDLIIIPVSEYYRLGYAEA